MKGAWLERDEVRVASPGFTLLEALPPSNLMADLIVLHIGAGIHLRRRISQYRRLLRDAIDAYDDERQDPVERLLPCTDTIERSELTNTGRGSSLNENGQVECDASILVSENGVRTQFSLCCCQSETPIRRCYERSKEHSLKSMGITQPLMLVDRGESVDLATEKTQAQYEHYKGFEDKVQDTVGGIFLQDDKVVAVSSSGGNFLKPGGRIGCAAVIGASVFSLQNDKYRVSVMCSGNGEDIVQMDLARSCCWYLLSHMSDSAMACHLLKEAIIGASKQVRLRAINEALEPVVYVGAVGFIQGLDEARYTLFYAHTTQQFVFAHGRPGDVKLCFSESKGGRFVTGQMEAAHVDHSVTQ